MGREVVEKVGKKKMKVMMKMNISMMARRVEGVGMKLLALGVCVMGWVVATGCAPEKADKVAPHGAVNSSGEPTRGTTPGAASVKVYEVKGIVKEIQAEKRRLRILHDEIPDYMPKMTMVFDVRDQSSFQELKVGQQVQFKMKVTEEDGWIESVKPTGVEVAPVKELGTLKLVKNVDPLFPGDLIPDMTFTNEFGKTVKLSDYQGKTLALSFIFTTCPFPTMCPKISSGLKEAARLLKDRGAEVGDWHFFSVTIDPERDTPSVMMQYGITRGYDSERWSYLTATLEDVELFGRQFGLMFGRDQGALNHNLRTIVIRPDRKLHYNLIGNEWTAEELVEHMKEASKFKAPNR